MMIALALTAACLVLGAYAILRAVDMSPSVGESSHIASLALLFGICVSAASIVVFSFLCGMLFAEAMQ